MRIIRRRLTTTDLQLTTMARPITGRRSASTLVRDIITGAGELNSPPETSNRIHPLGWCPQLNLLIAFSRSFPCLESANDVAPGPPLFFYSQFLVFPGLLV